MKLTIIGHKNLESEELKRLIAELQEAENILPYSSSVKEAIGDLRWKVQMELNKRERSKKVWMEFVASWSGYTSNQRKEVGRWYRRLSRDIANKLPSFYAHHFSDNTTNDWYIKQVSVKGKDSGSYSQQVDEIISKAMEAKND